MTSWLQIIIIGITAVLCAVVREPQIMCIFLAVCSLLLFSIHFWYQQNCEKQLSEMISYLSLVQERLDLPELKTFKEGQFGILQSEIYKVVVLLKETYSKELKQKKYMADILSDISHQIKTPIAAITIMTDLLESSELSEEERLEYAAKIDKQVNRITWLIRNLLTISQLEADVLELKQEKVNLHHLMERVEEAFELMAEVKNISLEIQINPEIWLVCDEHWTSEAFSNIVKNCIVHTPEGGRVSISASQDNFATHIKISDNGEGVEQKHLPHIFERFYKAGNTSSNSVGIGLSMTKQIVLKQNGTISVTSEKGKGTEFYVKMYRVKTV